MKMEDILTISAQEWAAIEEKDLAEYVAKGVHYAGYGYSGNMVYPMAELLKRMPKATEVVVGYRCTVGGGPNAYGTGTIYGFANATALIPKEAFFAEIEGVNDQFRKEPAAGAGPKTEE